MTAKPLTGASAPDLQDGPWPLVQPFAQFPAGWEEFVACSPTDQTAWLHSLRGDSEKHSETLHTYLALVSAYIFGYADSPYYGRLVDEGERQLTAAKISLERELFTYWLQPEPVSNELDQGAAALYLEKLRLDNRSLTHPLFPWLGESASRAAMQCFLWNDAIRNEVVDDEVAMLIVGLQGTMKAAAASNLWDECGRGELRNFHTYWLRRLISATGGTSPFLRYRAARRPWFTGITTNVFNAFLTRSGARLQAYGWFLINESWVAPHFDGVIAGARRVGWDTDDVLIYFKAHRTIDPRHTAELTAALRDQTPRLHQAEVNQILSGAHAAIAAGCVQYDYMHQYLTEIDAK
jgi:hypothetical protein